MTLHPSMIDVLLIDTHFWDTYEVSEVVCGGANGMDTAGEKWAIENNIPVVKFIPDWKLKGKRAGPIRNHEMGVYADFALIVHENSPGSINMVNNMKGLKKPYNEWVKIDNCLYFVPMPPPA